MTIKKRNRTRLFISACLSLLICVFGTDFAAAQKKPTEFNSQLDDKQLCIDGKPLNSTEYCDFWRTYTSNRIKPEAASKALAMDARNELIKYAQGRIDRFYEEYTNNKKFNRVLLETIFDVLEIGAAVTIGIVNGKNGGARSKEVIAAALTGFQAARTALNKNFNLLETRIVINKMRENRAQILTRIVDNMSKPVSDYSWLNAKNDLRQYLYAGTFGNALDSLAADTGAAAQNAETTLRVVSGDIVVVPEATAANASQAKRAQQILVELEKKLGDPTPTTKDAALTKLKSILEELKKDPDLKDSIVDTSDGTAMITLIKQVRKEVLLKGRIDLARKINETIISVNTGQ